MILGGAAWLLAHATSARLSLVGLHVAHILVLKNSHVRKILALFEFWKGIDGKSLLINGKHEYNI
jgi:hypothetical protein